MDIQLTDIQVHTTEVRNRPSIWRLVQKSFRNKKPGRIYFRNFEFQSDGTVKFYLDIPKDLQEQLEKTGEKLRLEIPDNLPVFPGKDTMEFLNSKRYKKLVEDDKN